MPNISIRRRGETKARLPLLLTSLLTFSMRVCRIALLLLPTMLSAQDVPYTTNGPGSLVGGTTIYNGRYVIIQSDFGFSSAT